MTDDLTGGVGEHEEPLPCACGKGYEGHDERHPRHPRPDYTLKDPYRRCKGCGAVMHWWETPAGKMSPHDTDGTNHFITCPFRDRFRRGASQRGASA